MRYAVRLRDMKSEPTRNDRGNENWKDIWNVMPGQYMEREEIQEAALLLQR